MIPINLTRQHIIQALSEIDKRGTPRSRESAKFHLIYEGRQYPPKYVISLANTFANGRELSPDTFSGGSESNGFLRSLGFEIIGGVTGKPVQPRRTSVETKGHNQACKKGGTVTNFEERVSSPRVMEVGTMEGELIKIGLVSFRVNQEKKETVSRNTETVTQILNAHRDLDFLVFAGWTLLSQKELGLVQQRNENRNAVCLLETWRDSDGEWVHHGYALQGKDTLISHTPQVFATSSEIGGDYDKMLQLLTELEQNRRVVIKGRTVTWLICGEINVLRNIQSDHNRVTFRMEEDEDLKERFDNILATTDLIANPTHTIMGNQGKIGKRREFLSRGRRVYCSTSNYDCTQKSRYTLRNLHSLQYCYQNGVPVYARNVVETGQYILRTFHV